MFCGLLIKRSISTTTVHNGKRNFRKFMLYNKRGTKDFKEQQKTNPDPDIPIYKRGVRDVGYTDVGKFVTVHEMIPGLIVPDLKDCQFKPYISYRAADVVQSEFTAQDLFDAVYSQKIVKDFKENKLKEDGLPIEASVDEKLTPDVARLKALQTGSDMF